MEGCAGQARDADPGIVGSGSDSAIVERVNMRRLLIAGLVLTLAACAPRIHAVPNQPDTYRFTLEPIMMTPAGLAREADRLCGREDGRARLHIVRDSALHLRGWGLHVHGQVRAVRAAPGGVPFPASEEAPEGQGVSRPFRTARLNPYWMMIVSGGYASTISPFVVVAATSTS